MAAQGMYPDPLMKITVQIAAIGAAILQALGSKITCEELLFEGSAGPGRRGPTGEELERRLLMWAGAVNKAAKRKRSKRCPNKA